MNEKLVTYISAYRRKCLKIGKGIPVEAGSANGSGFKYTTRDDTGDNISKDNEYYGELTVLYWIWKNGGLDKYDYISFRHYNKYLFLSDKKAVKLLKENKDGWIVSKARYIPPHVFSKEWEAFKDIIKNKFPLYYPELLKIYNETDGSGNKCNSTNMFITSTKQMSEYCEVLFKICNELRKTIGDTDHESYYQRYCALMAERFLTIYINTHSYTKIEADICYRKWFLKKMEKLVRSLEREIPIFKKFVQRNFRYKSMYRNK